MNTTLALIIGALVALVFVTAFVPQAQVLVKQLGKILLRIVLVIITTVFFGIITVGLWFVHQVLQKISWLFARGEKLFKSGSTQVWSHGGKINRKIGEKLS